MRIPSGKTDQSIYFFAADSTDLVTAETGLSSFTVYRSRNGGTATAYTTPTVSELSSANMPGLYRLLIDEDTTIASTSDSEEYAVTITATGMAPVHRVIELYRRDTTSGQTLTVTSGVGTANSTQIGGQTASASGTVTFPNATLASTTNITAGTITTATNVTTVNGLAANVITATSIASNAITAAKIATDAIGAAQLATDAVTEIATGLLDTSNGIETGLTPRQAWRVIAAACAGKASGLDTTTAVYRNAQADSVDRITATVDTNGNRTAVTLNLA